MPTHLLSHNISATFSELLDGVWDGRVDPGVLEACRRRMCELIGAPADAGLHASRPTPSFADPLTNACLAFAEMWVVDPHAVTDEMAAAVRSQLTDAEVAAFTIGLATIEAQARLTLALALIPGGAD